MPSTLCGPGCPPPQTEPCGSTSTARSEGLLVGGSAGAAAHAARECARALGRGALVVTLFPDGFERYLGKGVFENL